MFYKPRPHVLIRRAVPLGAERVTAMTASAYQKYVLRLRPLTWAMTVTYAQIGSAHSVWLLRLDRLPVGVLVLRHQPDALLIDSVVIDPA
jgi:hypothetical protein